MAREQFTGIQTLRFVAAMLVVLMHTSEAISLRLSQVEPHHYWTGGSAGVDIFFVISGFVMAISTAGTPSGSRSRLNAAWIFMQRRLLRIAPLYWFYTLLKVALVLALPSLALRSSIDAWHFAASLLFIPAMSPWGLIQPVLPVGWTLNFEMLFYALFATAIALGLPRIRFCLLVFLLIFLARQLATPAVLLTFYGQSLVFEFILGMGVAHIHLNHPPPAPLAGLLAALAGLAVMFGFDWSSSMDRFGAWGVGAGLMVLGAVWLEPWIARIRAASQLSFLGDASYSIYLSHTFVVPAAVLGMKQLGIHNPLMAVLAVSLSVIVSGCLSYLWLEQPMTRFLKRILFKTPKLAF
ncbi:MAG: acyltransferase [Pseudomonadota bacterium]|nr:acyltransferase [Pseudomonadota bacterium]